MSETPPIPPTWVSTLKQEDYTSDVSCQIENGSSPYVFWDAEGPIILDGEFDAASLRELADYMDAVKTWKARP